MRPCAAQLKPWRPPADKLAAFQCVRTNPAVDNPLEVIVAGQVMLLLNRHGLRDARCLSIYRRAVLDAV